MARGTEGPDSDIDILVSLQDDDLWARVDTAHRLSATLDREVQLVPLSAGEREPSLLAEALAEGRVLVDRDGEWERLKHEEPAIRSRAAYADQELRLRALAAVAALREEL